MGESTHGTRKRRRGGSDLEFRARKGEKYAAEDRHTPFSGANSPLGSIQFLKLAALRLNEPSSSVFILLITGGSC